MSFDPGMLHNNGHTAYANGTGPGIRETGVVEKLLTSYGFIQCSERQARLFFHCSQYNGNLQELKIGGEQRWTNRTREMCNIYMVGWVVLKLKQINGTDGTKRYCWGKPSIPSIPDNKSLCYITGTGVVPVSFVVG